MTILGPLVAPRTSTVTPASPRPEAVTFSPSTTITTGRVSVSPTPVPTLSISMTSPTATFCCLLPARTIAYTVVSFIASTTSGLPTRDSPALRSGEGGRPGSGRATTHQGFIVRGGRSHQQFGRTLSVDATF